MTRRVRDTWFVLIRSTHRFVRRLHPRLERSTEAPAILASLTHIGRVGSVGPSALRVPDTHRVCRLCRRSRYRGGSPCEGDAIVGCLYPLAHAADRIAARVDG